ncbi:MAG: cyclic nucleotide-binding domain-containing protein [Candidatus Marinimicrobia bacterium]|jgi:CRP-like cAMP-binding protein|nr:cyclic nucleotide-binding domain-containing protein [Candidatus Neomarinimicrobiota bacterium]MDP6789182.1 cyclic nucleotide-binding domain-containing protein [Candidatus Neomarinimicrobiota bacterium]
MNANELKDFSIFEGLSQDEMDTFNSVIKFVEVPTGGQVIREGEVGDSIYLLQSGEVEINQALTLSMNKSDSDNREKSIIKLSSDLKPLFGEMSLFHEGDRRTANVKALSDCRLAQIMKNDLFEICEANPKIGYRIMKNLGGTLSRNLVKANQNVLKLTTAFSLILER